MKQLYTIILCLILFTSVTKLNAANKTPLLNSNHTVEYKKSSSLASLTATISGTTSVCQGATSPVITFTGSGGTAPYTFTYKLNGISQTISTSGGNSSVTLPVDTSVAGTFVYDLVSVHDDTLPVSDVSQTGSATITVGTPITTDFTFSNDNSCSGTTIQFLSSVSTSGAITYSWDFGDGTAVSNLQNPTHQFTALGCVTSTFTVVLTVTLNGCTATMSKTVQVKQKPDISFDDANNSFDPFNNCSNAGSNPVFTINVENTSNSTCISSYSIDWGDGSGTVSNASFPATHTYNLVGAYNMVITAIGTNGCSNSKTYVIKNVTNPSGGIVSPGSTQSLCAPTAPINFTISNWGGNSAGTVYDIDYGDGSTMHYTQSDLQSSSYFNASNPSASLNFPIPHSYTTTNCPNPKFTASLVVSNACGETPSSVSNITVYSKPIANFTIPTTACKNTSVSFTNTSTAGYNQNCVQNSLYQWDFGDGTTSTLANPIHTYVNSGNYTVTLTAQAQCGFSEPIQKNICIEAPLVPQFTLNNTSGCTPLAITATNTTVETNSCTTPIYSWAVTYTAANCGTTVAIPIQTTKNANYNFTQPGIYSIKLTATNSCGSVVSSAQTVEVKKPPTVTINNISSFCRNTALNPVADINSCTSNTGITYLWTFTGGSPSSANTALPPPVTYAVPGNYSVSLAVTNECGTTTVTSNTFSVQDSPTVQNINITACSGNSFSVTPSNILPGNSIPVGTTYSWNAPVVTGGMTGGVSGTNMTVIGGTLINTTTNAQTATYTVTPKLGTCSGNPFTVIVTVNPAPTITTQPSPSTVCLNGTPTTLTVVLSSSSVTPSFQWYSNNNNSTIGGTPISGEINPSYAPPATVVGTLYYYCVITLSSGGCSDITTNIVPVTVNSLPIINSQPQATQSICIGASIAPLTVSYTGGAGTATYQWYSNTSNTTVGAVAVGTNSASYTPPAFNSAGTNYYYVTITLSGNGCGIVTSNIVEVIVASDPVLTTQPLTNQTVCQNSPASDLTVVASGGMGSSYNYQWYSNPNNTIPSGTLIPGATSATYSPPTDIVGTKYYYCIVSQTAIGCAVTSSIATVNVNASPTIINQPVSSTVCLGGAPTTLSFTYSNGNGTPTYQWFSSTTNTNTGGTPISGETGSTYTPPANSVGTIYYYCELTFASISGPCATIATNAIAVTVTQGASINTQPLVSQNLCIGTTIPNPLSVTYTDGTGTPTYQWFSNTNNNTTSGTPVGSNSPIYIPPVFTSSGTTYYYVKITFSGSGCGSVTSDTAEVIVTDDPIIDTQPLATQTVCQNTTASTLSVSASGGIGSIYNYQWYKNTVNNTSSGSLIAGEINNTFTPPTDIAGTIYYYCVITQGSGNGCDATSSTAQVVTNLAPTINNQPVSSTLCVNDPQPTLSFTYSNGVGTPTFKWFSNTTSSNSGGNLIVGANSATYSISTSNAGTFYYYCEVTFPSLTGGCSVITTNPATIIVNAIPVIASESTTICSSGTFTVTPANSGANIIPAGTTYTWTAPTINPPGTLTGAGAQSTPQTSISQTLINTSVNPVVVTYTVTPTSGTCVGTPFTVKVTVNPAINANVIINDNTCFGTNTASISTNITGGIPFSSGSPYNLSWSGPNGFTSTATTISNLSPGNYDLTITDNGSCPFFKTYTITEPTDIIVTTINEKDISCLGSNNGSIDINVAGGTGSYTYTWTKDGAPFATTQNISNLAPGDYQVAVTDANNCGPKTVPFTITEPPLLVVSLIDKTDVICFGEATGAINIDVSGGVPSGSGYNFAWTGPNGFTSSSQNLTNLVAGSYNLTVTDSQFCSKNLLVTISQSAEIKITYSTTPILCYGANSASLTASISGGIPPYQYTWSNLATTLNQTNLSAGDYTILVTDNAGCTKSQTINIPEAAIFTVNPVKKDISCFGAHDGSIALNLVGGKAPVTLVWSDGSTSGLTRNNLGPGSYTATISDGTPCQIVRTFVIQEPQPLVLSANVTNAFDCDDANSGVINLLVSGGTTPFTYLWSNGATTEDLNNVPAGNYLVTVTDARGCVKTAQYSINRPAPIVIGVSTKTDVNCDTKEVKQNFTAQVSGGLPPYQLSWSSGTVSGVNNETMSTSQNGTIVLNVTDALGCQANYSFNVAIPKLGSPSFTTNSYAFTTYGFYSIEDPVQFTNTATDDFIAVSWDFGDGFLSDEINPVHIYKKEGSYIVTQRVTYPLGCAYTYTVKLEIKKGYNLMHPNAFTPNNDSFNDYFAPVFKGLRTIVFDVYDTWGGLIYSETGETIKGWDGKIKGQEAENGNYYFKVTAKTFYGATIKDQGAFVLIK